MDADAELATLRRRAYGPHPDIAEDPVALARLAELERPSDRSRQRDDDVAVVAALEAAPSPEQSPVDRERRRRMPWHTGMVIAVAAVSLLVGGAAATRSAAPAPDAEASVAENAYVDPAEPAPAFVFASDPASEVLVHIPLDGPARNLFSRPAEEAAPAFPTDRDLQWTQSLGDYYGWSLSIARGSDDASCIQVAADSAVARCSTAEAQTRGDLFVSIPYTAIPERERPAGMSPEQSIGFWWIPGSTVLVLTGRTSDAAIE